MEVIRAIENTEASQILYFGARKARSIAKKDRKSEIESRVFTVPNKDSL